MTYSQKKFIITHSIALSLPTVNAPNNIVAGLSINDNFFGIVVNKTLSNSYFWIKKGLGNFTLQIPAFVTLDNAGGYAFADNKGSIYYDVVSTSYDDGKLNYISINS